MDLIKVIKTMNQEMRNKFPKINCGGCGKFAFTIYKSLLNIEGVSNIKIVFTFYKDDYLFSGIRIHKLKLNDENVISRINIYNWSHIMVKFKYNGKVYYVDPLRVIQEKDLDRLNIASHYSALTHKGIIKVIRKAGIDWNIRWTSLKKDNKARLVMKKHLRPHFKKGK
mgnify:FL=1|jgi:hypothetical protein